MKTSVVVDITNLFWRSVAAQNTKFIGTDSELTAGMALHGCLLSLRKYYRLLKPDEFAVAFEGSNNWRKDYTKSNSCVSGLAYKGNRVFDPKMAVLIETLTRFEELVMKHTSIIVLKHPRLEGDDQVAAYCQHREKDHNVIILSGDKDYASLIRQNVKLLNPDTGKYRELVDLCGIDDPKYFMFEKCVRGDSGDNVLSAYPRVRKTRIQKAYSDEFEYNNFMNETWEFIDKNNPEQNKTMRVGDLFEENKRLMDLSGQPSDIREIMRQNVIDCIDNRGKFSYPQFYRFLAVNNLTELERNADSFVDMFSCNQHLKTPKSMPVKTDIEGFTY